MAWVKKPKIIKKFEEHRIRGPNLAFMKLLEAHDCQTDLAIDQAIKQCGMKTHIPASGLPYKPASISENVVFQMEEVMGTLSHNESKYLENG